MTPLDGVALFVSLATVRAGLYYAVVYGVVVAAATWVYRDACDREISYPWAWAAATLFLTIVPVLAYLYVRRGTTSK
jgi:uncharacterized membrane protein YvlD (DUF360 family)